MMYMVWPMLAGIVFYHDSAVVKKCWEWCIELRFIGNIQCSYRVKCHIVAYSTNHYDYQWLINSTGKREHGTCNKQNVIQPTMIALMTNVPSIQTMERDGDGTSACNLIGFISLIIEGSKQVIQQISDANESLDYGHIWTWLVVWNIFSI